MKPMYYCLLLTCILLACGESNSAITGQKSEGISVDSPSLTASSTIIALQNDVPVTGLSGAKANTKFFSFAVPAGASDLKFTITGGEGDADIYVRFGAQPSTEAYDYRPYLDGNEETVVPAAATEGTWYVMIRAYSAYSGVSLTAHLNADTPGGGSGGIDCAEASTWPAGWTAFEDQVLTLVNEQRAAGATCGSTSQPAVPPLAMNDALRRAARCHSLDMATHNYFDHNSQDGRTPWNRISAAGYTGFGAAENIAAGQSTAAAVMQTWMNSPGHCVNIMNGSVNEIGIGYAFDASATYDHYWTQDFGQR